MLGVSLDATALIAGLQGKKQIFSVAMQEAVKETSRIAMVRILDRIPRPPSPPGQVYERTGRLVAGYGPAASFLGIGAVPSGEGSYIWHVGEDKISFTLINEVDYALGVEWVGPWSVPPNAPGGPQHYGEDHGRHAVLFSFLETEGEFAAQVASAWAKVIA